MKVKIIEGVSKPFKGDDNVERDYTWYKALRLSDGVTIRFGSMEADHELDTELDLNIEKYERRDGTIGYKEIL